MTKYEEMCEAASEFARNKRDLEMSIRQSMALFVQGFETYCGIAQDRVSFLSKGKDGLFRSKQENGNKYGLQAAITIEDGRFQLPISISLGSAHVTFVLWMSEEEGKLIINIGPGERTEINLSDPTQCDEFYESMVKKVKLCFRECKDNPKTIGFTIS